MIILRKTKERRQKAEQKKCSVVIGYGEVEVDEYGDKYYDGYDVVHEF